MPSTPTDGVFTAPGSPTTTLSAPTTPTLEQRVGGGMEGEGGGEVGLGRCRSEGDLAGDAWHTLSRVVQEAGHVLKTLSETSLALRHQATTPAAPTTPLPPLLEEGARRVSSVAVQTDPRHVPGLWRDVYTSCDSLSDGDTSESGGPWRTPPRRWLEVPRQRAAPPLSPPRGLYKWRERRERLSRPAGYGGRSSSSEWESASTGAEREPMGVGVGGHRCLALHQRHLEESCRRLEDRLRLSARKRHLRRQILSEHHNHYNDAHRCVLHSSLDYGSTPFCTHMGPPPPSPYFSTPALPTAGPPSPSYLCCCVSPVHQPRHQHCRALASPCAAHAHCHVTPPPEPTHSPVSYRDARLEASRRQCREQLAAARRLLGGGSSSSLGEGSSPSLPRRPRLSPAGGSLDAHQRHQRLAATTPDTPYLRGHAASLSSLPGAGGAGGAWRRGGLGGLGGLGSLGSVASEGEADHRRASCWRGDSDLWRHGAPRLR